MKRLLMFLLIFFICSQICIAEERITTIILKDGSEVSGVDLGSSNGVFRIHTDSGIVEVKSNDVEEISEKVSFSYDDLNINKDDADNANEEEKDCSDNQYDEDSNNFDYRDRDYEENYNDSDYQNESYEEESNDSDYEYED